MALHIHTPLIASPDFSARSGAEVWLKLECLQPAGSFKIRGIGHACETLQAQGARGFVSSSGGNAGYAVAYAGRRLNAPVRVVVPETTSARARQLIAQEGADVIVHGSSWQEANAHAQSLLGEAWAFIHPFDDPLLWEGHASMIDELTMQMQQPDLIICSVGGGGLLAGVAQGLLRRHWHSTAILAVETEGAASYAAALASGRPATLPAITSIATSLGAREVSTRPLELARELRIDSLVLSDRQAVQGVADLLDSHRVLTEPACGVSLAALDHVAQIHPDARRIAVIVCGGVGITHQQLNQWLAA